MSPLADSLGMVSASTKGVVNVIDHKGLTVMHMDLYVAERPRSKHSARIAFTLEPMPIYSIRLKIIGQLKRTKFLVDIISPVKDDDWKSPLPPLTRTEAKELVSMVQEHINKQLMAWARRTPDEEARVCSNITPDLLDAEILHIR
tara:strand:- start:354 stop:788 length:435 start_codon:yes stop_codon:yes gene_type:complete